mgnify:CR=1 FL=1
MISETQLISARENIYQKLQTLFDGKAIESHVLGSIARGTPDAYSDIDIWYTFKDEEFDEVFNNRFEYYKEVGNIIHSNEAHQNAPTHGVHTGLLIGSEDNTILTVVDIYLCPLSTSYITEEGKKLYGIDLPIGIGGFNPKKVQVDENYRINFFIGFIFGTIKKTVRKEGRAFDAVLREYTNLKDKYTVPVEPLVCTEQGITLLEEIMDNTMKVANEKQKQAIEVIRKFARNVLA